MTAPPVAVPPGKRLLGGPALWVLILAVLLTLLAAARWVAPLFRSPGEALHGDGRDPETYGFDLSTCLVPRETLVAGGLPRDGLPAMVSPSFVSAAEIPALNEAQRGKVLVSSDRVVGLTLNGDSRAYPLSILNWHEVVNDTVGGVPVAVTYNPLCDAVAVFDRRMGEEVLELGVSGLLYNSNLLLYDRRGEAGGESLWSQLQARAVAGPAAVRGERLAVIPSELVRWSRWRAEHPDGLVLARDPAYARRYRRDPYSSYFGSDLLRFPVDPLPASEPWPLKTRVVAVRAGGAERVYPLPAVARRAGESGRWKTELGGVGLRLTLGERGDTMTVEALVPDTETETLYAFWFAWYAHHPESDVLGP